MQRAFGIDSAMHGRALPVLGDQEKWLDPSLHQVLAGLATGGIYACLTLAIVTISRRRGRRVT